MFSRTDDLRIDNLRPLLPPAILMEEFPASEEATDVVVRGREDAGRLLSGRDDRLLVVVGPCSIHDPAAALEYAHRLFEVATEFEEDLFECPECGASLSGEALECSECGTPFEEEVPEDEYDEEGEDEEEDYDPTEEYEVEDDDDFEAEEGRDAGF